MNSLNLRNLSANSVKSIETLQKLAMSSDAPLRLEKRGGQIYLGVRTWPTYFFEKIVASEKEIAHTEGKTQKAIEMHVRSFLTDSNTTFNEAEADAVIFNLHKRTTNKLITRPVFLKAVKTPGAEKRQDVHANNDLRKVNGKRFDDAILVPKGISIAALSTIKKPDNKIKNIDDLIQRLITSIKSPAAKNTTLHVTADARLVRKETYESATKSLLRGGTTFQLGSLPSKIPPSSEDFSKYYKRELNGVATAVKTTVILELHHDLKNDCSKANVQGALNAANRFMDERKLAGKPVSVMLTVPKLPSDQTWSKLKTSQTAAVDGDAAIKKPSTTSKVPSRSDLILSESSSDESSDDSSDD